MHPQNSRKGRPATGQIWEREGKRGTTYALRFRAYGERRCVTLGSTADGWNRERAEAELRHVLADVERGLWQPPRALPDAPERPEDPGFHAFASEWLTAREPELRPRTVADYRWALSLHLLPAFARHQLSEITAEEVDRYKSLKLREGKLGPAQVNKTLKRLAQILEVAVDYGYLPSNPAAAKGGRRRLKEPKPRRSWVEPEQLPSLLEGASSQMRPLFATLAGAGLRVSEACALDWKDINLATGTLVVRQSKTAAGEGREVDLPLGLADELRSLRAQSPQTGQDRPVFLSSHRAVRRQTAANVARRLKTAIRHANTRLEQLGIEPISEAVTPHSLRRTFASIRAALRDDPIRVAEQGGWRDPGFVFRVYQKATKRREKLSGAYASEYDRALDWSRIGRADDTAEDWAQMGTNGGSPAPEYPPRVEGTAPETAL